MTWLSISIIPIIKFIKKKKIVINIKILEIFIHNLNVLLLTTWFKLDNGQNKEVLKFINDTVDKMITPNKKMKKTRIVVNLLNMSLLPSSRFVESSIDSSFFWISEGKFLFDKIDWRFNSGKLEIISFSCLYPFLYLFFVLFAANFSSC